MSSPAPTDPNDPTALLAHAAWARRLVRRLVAAHDVDDVVQQTLLAAVTQPEPPRSWRAFLTTVAQRCALRLRRDTTRRRRRELAIAKPAALPSTADLLLRVQAERDVAQLVAELDEPFRTVVLLHFFEGLEPTVIAARLGVPAATVRTRLHRGLDRLRQRLAARRGAAWCAGLAQLFGLRPPPPTLPLLTTALVMSTTWKTFVSAAAVGMVAVALWWLQQAPEPMPTPPAPEPAVAAEPARASLDVQPAAAASREEATPKAAVPAVAQPPVLRGRVVDSRGAPLAAVPVHWRALELSALRLGDPLPHGEAISDSFGVFALPRCPGTAAPATGVGYTTLRTTACGDEEPADLLLVAAPAIDLAGRVVDAHGLPLTGVRVQVMTLLLEEYPGPLAHALDPQREPAMSGEDGRFVLPNAPLAAGVNLLFTKTGYESQRVPSLQPASGFLQVTMPRSTSAEGRIVGTVLDAAGRPVVGAELRLGWDQATQSSARGEFVFEFPKRPSRLLAMHRGFQPVVREAVSKDTPMPLVLELRDEALAIGGRIVDARGAPLPDLLVNLVDPTRAGQQASAERLCATEAANLPEGALARSDAEGRFLVTGLCDRTYRLRAYDPQSALSVQSEPVAAGSRDVVLTVPADAFLAELRGRVVGTNGQAVAGAVVSTSLVASTADGIVVLPGPNATSDAEGRFLLRKVPRRHLELYVSGDDLVSTEAKVEDLLQRPEVQIVVLRRCHVQIEGEVGLTVRLLDAAGKELYLQSFSQGSIFGSNAWVLRTAKSPVLAIAESATTMVWARGEKELGRKSIVVEPGPDRVTTLLAAK